MQVILLERIEKLGQMGDIVTVKPGYARNYLLPQKKARRATKENLTEFERQRAQLEAENLKRREEADRVAGRLHGMTVTLIRQAGESGQLYGSVNTRDLGKAVSAAGVTIDRGQVVLDNVIKTLGLHRVKIRLHPEVIVTIAANVARSEAEAEAQAKAGHLVSAEEQRAAQEAAAAAAISELEKEEESEAAVEEGDAPDAGAPAGPESKEDAKQA